MPGNWFLQGHDYNGAAWYARDLGLAALPAGAQAWLEFDGADYWTDVWVNGHHVGHHEGYFEPFAFDIAARLTPGRNRITVRVDAPTETPGTHWSLFKRQIKGVLNHHDTRPGGAWSPRGQESGSGGLWQPVRLRITDGAAFGALRTTTRLAADHATARIEGRASLRLTATAQPVRLDWTLTALPVGDEPAADLPAPQSGRVRIGAADRAAAAVPFAIDVRQPRLWWPAALGTPARYRLELRLRDAAGRVLDRSRRDIGLREVGRDAASGQWSVNGRRLFLKGSNYIGTHWLSELDRERAEADLRLMQAAHINTVRVHAHVASPAFYEAADALGMLLWQDFPLQWGYVDDAAFHAEAERQARAMVGLLGHHPAILNWCLHNEPPWESPWMKYVYDDWQPGQNQALDARLLAAVRAADDSRPAQAISGTAEHPWYGWYSNTAEKYLEPTTQPLITEFGAQALLDEATLRSFLAPDQLWPTDDRGWKVWEFHNFQRKETFQNAKLDRGPDLATFIARSQAYQARVIEVAAESYRRQKYAPVGGSFQFLFVEPWASISWAAVDYRRQPKAGYAALARAYQPVLPSLAWHDEVVAAERRELALPLTVVSDLDRPLGDLRVRVSLLRDGEWLGEASERLSVAADAVSETRVARLPLPATPGRYRIEATVEQGDLVLGRNERHFERR